MSSFFNGFQSFTFDLSDLCRPFILEFKRFQNITAQFIGLQLGHYRVTIQMQISLDRNRTGIRVLLPFVRNRNRRDPQDRILMCNRIAQGLFVPLQVSFDSSFFKAQKLDVLQVEVDGRLCVVNALKAAICHQNVVG